MSDIERFDNKVWDRFFDFLFIDEEPSRQEVQKRLHTLGIDVTPALSKVQQAIKSSQARQSLEAARTARPSLTEKVVGIIAPAAEHLRDSLRQLITTRLSGTAQGAYFRKLEQAASDSDLQSLIDDLDRLEKFSKDE